MKSSILYLLISFFGLISCGETGNLHFKEGEIQNLDSEISFNSLRTQILSPKCISCHTNYKNFDVVSGSAEVILNSIETGRMPKNSSPLRANEINFFKDWIAAGKPRGNESERDQSEGEKIYADILGPKCVQCHNPNGEAKFLDLSSRQAIWNRRAEILNFEDPQNSYLIEVITDPEEPMPPSYSKLERLTEDEVERLKEWIKRGMP